MAKQLFLLVLLALAAFLVSCSKAEAPAAEHEEEAIARTEFTDRIENFFEYSPLRVGKANRLLLERAGALAVYEEPIAFVIGNNPRMLEEAADHLHKSGVSFQEVAHAEYESLVLRDPDGRPIELYYWPEW